MTAPGSPSTPGRARVFRSSAWWRSGLALWSSTADAPRKRRPSDVLALVVGAVVVAVVSVPAAGSSPVETSVAHALSSLPGLFEWLWATLYAAILAWAFLLIVAALVTRHRRIVFAEQIMGAALALAIGVVVALRNGAELSDVWASLVPGSTDAIDPTIHLAIAAAVVGVTSAHLARMHRRIGVWILALGSVGAIAIGVGWPLALLAALALGVTAAAAVHLAFGSPGGHRPIELLRDQLSELGIDTGRLEYVQEDVAAVARGTDAEGFPILVRVYDRDAFEGSLFRSVWDRLWYRRPASTSGRQLQAEHEAFVTLVAERAGAPVQSVRAAGAAFGRDTLLVRNDVGRRFAEVPPGEMTVEHARRAWRALAELHGTGVAHGALSPSAVYLEDDGSVLLTDLGAATTSPRVADRSADRARLLVITALAIGVADAVDVARDSLAEADLIGSIAFLQPAAFDHDLRRSIKSAPWSVKDLRTRVAESTSTEPPPLEKLRRVSPGSIVMMALLVVIVYAMIGAISGIGWDNIVAQFSGANWWWVGAAVVVAAFVYVGQAIAMQGAAVDRLPFVPVLGLEASIAFIGLVVPSSAAKVGLTIRFLQLAGSNPVAAVPISLIDSLSGLVVQILVIVLTLFTGLVTLTPSDHGGLNIAQTLGDLNWGLILFVAAALLVVAVLVVIRLPRARAFATARLTESRDSLRVFRMPRKIGQIVFGSVMWNVIQALVLGCALSAFGGEATFAELILVNTLVALFSGLMPIPGNVGVAEAAITAGLIAIGVDSATALSTAIVYRLATYFVPPFYGYASLRTLRAKGYL